MIPDIVDVDVNVTGEYNISALHLAALHGHLDVVKLLIMSGKKDKQCYNRHHQTLLKDHTLFVNLAH